MTDPVARKSLLAENVFPREQAIHDADAAIEDLNVAQIIEARDPLQAPLGGVLEALAWERSVDVWDPTWPEATKRAVVIAAPDVHRHKGTVYAVKTALSALGVVATVTEWWQTTPAGAPYTFSVKAYAQGRLYDGPLLDTRLIRVIYNSVLRTKPHSRAFDLTVGAGLQRSLALVPALAPRVVVAKGATPRANNHLGAELALATVLVGRVTVSRAMVPVLPS